MASSARGLFVRWACTLLAAAVCCGARGALAHAPQARSAALTPNAAAIAIALPGFGILTRNAASQPFAYVCDAVLAHQPSDLVPALAFQSEGSLLVGTNDGLRILAPNSCPLDNAGNDLSGAAVIALTAYPEIANLAYAVTAGDRPGVWRSVDGGRKWQARSPLANANAISALLFDPSDPDAVYLSQSTTADHAALLVSSNGGTSFTTFEQARALRLLHRQAGPDGRLWAMARAATNVSNRGFDILRAERPDGPWLAVLRVNYFGGFAIEPGGSIWVGDEGGGVYRSRDGGDTFDNVAPQAAVACLVYAGDTLWACTPGTNQEPALGRWVEARQSFERVVAFTDVDRLVECDAQIDVPRHCANAWVEWQRDVLMQNVSMPDAGLVALPDAALLDTSRPDSGVPAGDAGVMTSPDAPPGPVPTAAAPASCAMHGQRPSASPLWFGLSVSLLIRRRVRARYRNHGHACRG